MRVRNIAVLGILAALAGIWLLAAKDVPERPSAIGTDAIDRVAGETSSTPDRASTAGQKSDASRDDPGAAKEIIGSIFDLDLAYRRKAEQAAEDSMRFSDPASYLRWRPVRVVRGSLLDGDLLDRDAMPESLSITPFPDTSFVAVRSKFSAYDHLQSSMWEGSILGTDYGRVEITTVGATGEIGFDIRIIDYPRVFRVFQTESPDVYIAIETNPYPQDSE